MADDIFDRGKRESIGKISSFENTGELAFDLAAAALPFKGAAEIVKKVVKAPGADVKDVLKGLEDLFNALNEILVQADTLGVNPDRLQRLTRAGRAAGVTDDVTLGGLTNLARVLQKEREGGKQVETLLDQFGIDIKGSNGRPKDLIQIFREVSDKLANQPDPTKRLDLAAQAFGQDNVTLVQLAKLGSKQIGELGANVTTFSRELLQAAAEFRKSGLIVNEDKLFRLIEPELQKFGVVTKAREGVNLGPSRDGKRPIEPVRLGIRDGKAVEIKPGESPFESQQSGDAPGDAILAPATLPPEALEALQRLDADFAGLAEAFRSGLVVPFEEIAKCCQELPLLLGPEAIAVAPAPPPPIPGRDEFRTLGDSLQGSPDARNGASGAPAAALAELEGLLGGIEGKAGEAGQTLLHLFDNLSREGASFTGVLGGIADALGGIGGKAGEVFGILSKLFGGGGLEGLLGSIGSLGGLFGFAGGGTLQPGFPAIVGERGPELFIPSAPGRIVNNAGAQGMVAGQTINIVQHMTFTTDVRNSVRAEILNTAPAIVEASKRAVAEAVTRGRGGGTLFR